MFYLHLNIRNQNIIKILPKTPGSWDTFGAAVSRNCSIM